MKGMTHADLYYELSKKTSPKLGRQGEDIKIKMFACLTGQKMSAKDITVQKLITEIALCTKEQFVEHACKPRQIKREYELYEEMIDGDIPYEVDEAGWHIVDGKFKTWSIRSAYAYYMRRMMDLLKEG
ncbi:hypothetical protein EOM86_05655 [Candidatus Nomurabacteria bacterium]|nr:hypothetical protein [Candidatus Nomurabacteria bacterium]